MGSGEHISFLAGSENRVRVLETLRDRPYRQSDLVRECRLSRSTVHRALNGFTERDWVARRDGTFRLTAGGALVLDRYHALETTVERVDEWGSFLRRLGDVATDLPAAALDDATLVTTSRENPHAGVSCYAGAFGPTTRTFRGILPIVSPVLNAAARRLLSTETEMSLLINESVLETSAASYPDALDDAHTAPNFALYLSTTPLSFGLGIFDDRVIVCSYDGNGVIRECLDGTNEPLYTWANDLYESRLEAARRVDSAAP